MSPFIPHAVWIFAATLAVAASSAHAQRYSSAPSSGSTSGSASPVSGSSSSSSTSSSSDSGSSSDSWVDSSSPGGSAHRQPRRPLYNEPTGNLVEAPPGHSRCSTRVDGVCFVQELRYIGERQFGFGVAHLAMGELWPTVPTPFHGRRGEVGSGSVEELRGGGHAFRLWLVWSRLRIGLNIAVAASVLGGSRTIVGGSYEDGSYVSRRARGMTNTYFLAYALQLSPHLQVWIGGFVGLHQVTAEASWGGRGYDLLIRRVATAGPEVVFRIVGRKRLGLIGYVATDLLHRGMVSFGLGISFEMPKPPGRAFWF